MSQVDGNAHTGNEWHVERSSLVSEGQTVQDFCGITFNHRRFYFTAYLQQWKMVTRREGKVCDQSPTDLLLPWESSIAWKGQRKEDPQRENDRHVSHFCISVEYGIMTWVKITKRMKTAVFDMQMPPIKNVIVITVWMRPCEIHRKQIFI